MLKLKESGKISEDDIKRVVSEYEKLDRNNLRKITLIAPNSFAL